MLPFVSVFRLRLHGTSAELWALQLPGQDLGVAGGSPLMAYSAASNAAHLGLELMHGFLHSQTKAVRELKQATYGDSLSSSTSEGPAFEIRKQKIVFTLGVLQGSADIL